MSIQHTEHLFVSSTLCRLCHMLTHVPHADSLACRTAEQAIALLVPVQTEGLFREARKDALLLTRTCRVEIYYACGQDGGDLS